MTTKLYRTLDDAMSAGVIAGFAQFLGWSATRLRLVYFLGTLITGLLPGVILYLVLWFLMPVEPASSARRTAA